MPKYRQSQMLHVALLCSMMTSLLTPKRYVVTIALRVPGCSQPSRHRWHASCPSQVGYLYVMFFMICTVYYPM